MVTQNIMAGWSKTTHLMIARKRMRERERGERDQVKIYLLGAYPWKPTYSNYAPTSGFIHG
jgi:hypothetical protein